MTTGYVDYEYMRDMVEETMLYTAQRLAFMVDYDTFGGEVPIYTPAETMQCGFKTILVSEQPSFTGVAQSYDAKLRLAHSTHALFQDRDRIRVTADDTTFDYEIIGPIGETRFTVLLEIAKVRDEAVQ